MRSVTEIDNVLKFVFLFYLRAKKRDVLEAKRHAAQYLHSVSYFVKGGLMQCNVCTVQARMFALMQVHLNKFCLSVYVFIDTCIINFKYIYIIYALHVHMYFVLLVYSYSI